MADRPGSSYKSSHNVSRHTMVMRKAKDEDARRLAETDEVEETGSRRLEVPPAARRPDETSVIAAPESSRRASGPTVTGSTKSPSGRVISGRTVVVRREGDVSKRLSVSTHLVGDRAASVRVTGGDTIIRYQSGDMVVKRGARRAQLRRQLIWAYALGYLLLFGVFAYFLITGTVTMTPQEFVNHAFAKRHGTDVIDLERAAMEAMRGNRTPAEVRLAQALSFYDENKDLVKVEAGSRLTLPTAAKLGQAIIEDQKKPESQRSFTKPFRLYKETYIANMNWPHWLSLYNALGFFLLLILFLWRPLLNYLGTQGKKTAAAIRDAREAQEQALEYRNMYRRLATDLQERGEKMRVEIDADTEAGLKAALTRARRQAEGIEGGVSDALNVEAGRMVGNLGAKAAADACDRARVLLEQRLGPKEHDAAIEELIADISGMRIS